jgi:LmbE family N-acetylglucosaminyl deacetylase
MKKNTIAIIVPHGDDEVLGFGGVIQKHVKKGDKVHVIFARKPIDQRTKKQFEAIADAQKILGYQKYHCTEMSEIEMSHEPLFFFRRLEIILSEINPNIVYTTFYNDIHQDHKIVFDWVCRAVRVWGPLNVKQFYVGEIPSSSDQYPTITGRVFTPNHYVILNENELAKKIKALQCYTTEICKYPHPRSSQGIISKTTIRGQEAGEHFAEAFMCLRYIIETKNEY